MAETQDNMTPEEKLLNVIQSGGDKPASGSGKEQEAGESGEPVKKQAAAEKAPVIAEKVPEKEAAAKPVVPDAGQTAKAKGRMKLAESAKKPEAGRKAVSVPEDELPVAAVREDAAAGSPVILKKQSGGAVSGIRTINRMLAAGIIGLLSMSGLEVFRAIKGGSNERLPAEIVIPKASDSALSVLDVQNRWGVDVFWRGAEGLTGDGVTTTTTTVTVNSTPWGDYMRQNIKLMGVSIKKEKSDSEAILMDNTDRRMYVVRIGASISVQGASVRLDDLEYDRARFSDGKNSVELK